MVLEWLIIAAITALGAAASGGGSKRETTTSTVRYLGNTSKYYSPRLNSFTYPTVDLPKIDPKDWVPTSSGLYYSPRWKRNFPRDF